jgi:hypothetical protein
VARFPLSAGLVTALLADTLDISRQVSVRDLDLDLDLDLVKDREGCHPDRLGSNREDNRVTVEGEHPCGVGLCEGVGISLHVSVHGRQ